MNCKLFYYFDESIQNRDKGVMNCFNQLAF